MAASADQRPLVAVIDDDQDVREALQGLFRSVGLKVEAYQSSTEFLSRSSGAQPGCLVLDVRLPGKSGLEFYDELVKRDMRVPVVFISGHADVAMSVRAMKAGAVEFLTKPVRDQDLLDAVHLAIERGQAWRYSEEQLRRVRAGFASLSAREKEILRRVVGGGRNREIAAELGLSEATVKLHRSHIMQKLQAENLVGLIRLADLHAQHEVRAS